MSEEARNWAKGEQSEGMQEMLLEKYKDVHPADLMDKVHEELVAILLKTTTIEDDAEWNATMAALQAFVKDVKELMLVLDAVIVEG